MITWCETLLESDTHRVGAVDALGLDETLLGHEVCGVTDLLSGHDLIVAAALLATAGDNGDRMCSEASLTVLCGKSPIVGIGGSSHLSPAQPRLLPVIQQRLAVITT